MVALIPVLVLALALVLLVVVGVPITTPTKHAGVVTGGVVGALGWGQ